MIFVFQDFRMGVVNGDLYSHVDSPTKSDRYDETYDADMCVQSQSQTPNLLMATDHPTHDYSYIVTTTIRKPSTTNHITDNVNVVRDYSTMREYAVPNQLHSHANGTMTPKLRIPVLPGSPSHPRCNSQNGKPPVPMRRFNRNSDGDINRITVNIQVNLH